MAQERVQKSKAAPQKEAEVVEDVEVAVDEEAEKLKAETDALLEDIDNLLDEIIGESTALDFVNDFKQKGGE